MLLDDFNPSLWKMLGVWYAAAGCFWYASYCHSKNGLQILRYPAALVGIVFFASLISHQSKQNEILMWVTIVFTIVMVLLHFIMSLDLGPTKHDLKMYGIWSLWSPAMIGVCWVVIAVCFAIGHYIYDWLQM